MSNSRNVLNAEKSHKQKNVENKNTSSEVINVDNFKNENKNID